MNKNIGDFDRVLRFLLGVALIVGAVFSPGAWQLIAVPGVVLALTAVFRFCPAYWLLRIRTLARPASLSK